MNTPAAYVGLSTLSTAVSPWPGRVLAAAVGLCGLLVLTASQALGQQAAEQQAIEQQAIEQQAVEKQPPNIVFILADDLGYGDVGCYGCTDTETPAIDRLATQGVRFTDFYSNGPECTPTRTALMTGRYQQRVGGLECAIGTGNVGRYDDAIRLCEQGELGLPAEQNALVRGLKAAGYRVVCQGKWHLGYNEKFWPLKHGFDHYFGPLGGGVDYYYHTEWDGWHVLHEDGKEVFREGYMTDLISQGAVEFLDAQTGQQPFFLYVPYTAPHTPLEYPDAKPDKPRTEENWNDGDRKVYAAVVERLDRGVGQIIETLNRRNLADNTLLIFCSDNGGTKKARNEPLSGTKGTTYDGGIRVPCIIRWPGKLEAGAVTAQPTMTLDLTASMLTAAGARAPAELPSDGIDVIARLRKKEPVQPRTLFWRKRRGEQTWWGVRDGDWKYVRRADGDKVSEELFDLAADIGEHNDLLAQQPERLARMKKLLAEWEEEVKPTR